MSAKKAGKIRAKSAKKSAKPKPALVPRPDGRGALLTGGMPGNAGGPGRQPSAVRAALLESGAARIARLEQIADGEPIQTASMPLSQFLTLARCMRCDGEFTNASSQPADKVFVRLDVSAGATDQRGAIDTMLKYGLGEKSEMTVVSSDVQARVQRMVEIIAGQPTWESQALLSQLEVVWT